MKGIRVENSQGVIAGSTVNAQGDVLVNGQKITNIYYSAQYQDLKNHKEKLEARFATTRQKIEKYPDDEDFKKDLLLIDQERNEVQKKLDDLQREVIQLAETFTKIPVNTDRLKLAQQHFEAGDYAAARAILDAEQMGNEQSFLLRQKEQQQHQLAETENLLINNANEFLILARLTAVNFDLSDRFEKTVEYFEQSLKAAHTHENTFDYADFLHQHNQFNAAIPFYQEALRISRSLAGNNPQTYLPDVAKTLNNLASSQKAKNEFIDAEEAYQEALEIRRRLAETNPQNYLQSVARTLHNLANLQRAKNNFPAAEAAYQEALGIYHCLADTGSQIYLPDVVTILNNLAILQAIKNDFPAAEASLWEALGICRRLAEINPQTYLSPVSGTLNNLGNLQKAKNDFPAAEDAYQKALEIRRSLAEANPHTYLPDVATTLNNLANLQTDKNEFSAAEDAYQEVLKIYRRLNEANPQVYLPYVATTLNNFGNLQKAINDFPAAEDNYKEALEMRRSLAEANPHTYLPDVATTLNNLANLQVAKKEFSAAEDNYQEALGICRHLAETNPQAYLPHVVRTATNMSLLYLQYGPDKEKSLAYAKEALAAGLPFVELIPDVQNNLRQALQVAEAWGLDRDAFREEAVKLGEKRELEFFHEHICNRAV